MNFTHGVARILLRSEPGIKVPRLRRDARTCSHKCMSDGGVAISSEQHASSKMAIQPRNFLHLRHAPRRP